MTKASALLLLSLAILLAMGLWFGVSAVGPQIAKEWRLDEATTAWLTLSVQLGFVGGTLLSAMLNLPDVISARHLFTLCAFLGAVANAVLAAFAHSAAIAIALRVVTGMCLAGVYPPGMKLIATWWREGRGFALGVLIGALTLGKASPYLVNALGSSSWRVNVALASVFALFGAIVVGVFVVEGPYALPNQPFDFAQVAQVVSNRGVRL
ncbi:MAG TPA: MFS transporter, partial [Thermoanaerobaculia bacterium]|nr:MFS transporter [Thermoanaerobaculia bacterium]